MQQQLGLLSLVVRDYDEAIAFYTEKLGFELQEDSDRGGGKRWITVLPPGSKCGLLLARAVNEQQTAAIGNQTGGRVFLFLYTDDFWRDFKLYTGRGIRFVRPPKEEEYGTVAVFEDLCGNLWDLIEPAD